MTPQSPSLDPKLLAAIDSLGGARAVTLLNAVASAHAHSEGPTPAWSAELGRALCAEFEVAPASWPASSATLAREALKLLAADAKYAGPIRVMIDGPSAQRLLDPIGRASLAAAVPFAPPTHIELERSTDGTWSSRFEKNPTPDPITRPIITKLHSISLG